MHPEYIYLSALVFACIVCTGFPLLYLLVPWFKTAYGRAVMLQAWAVALLLDLTLLTSLAPPDKTTFYMYMAAALYTLAAVASGYKIKLLVATYLSDLKESSRKVN